MPEQTEAENWRTSGADATEHNVCQQPVAHHIGSRPACKHQPTISADIQPMLGMNVSSV